MQFRATIGGERDRIRSLSAKIYDKLNPLPAIDESVTGVDREGTPRIVMEASKTAEIYLAIDHEWGTPAMRWNIIKEAFGEIRKRLREKGYKTAYCFFAEGVPNGYIRRLVNEMGADRVMDRCIRFTEGES
jgi:hypothetical protein